MQLIINCQNIQIEYKLHNEEIEIFAVFLLFGLIPINAIEDTVVIYRSIPEKSSPCTDSIRELKYFVCCGEQESAFSCLFFINEKRIERIKIASCSCSLSFQEKNLAFQKILEKIHSDGYCFQKNSMLILDLGDWGSETINISDGFEKLRKAGDDYNALKTAVLESCLYKEIMKTLKLYSVFVSEIEIEKIHVISSESFLRNNSISNEMEKRIFSATVYLHCRREIIQ